MRKYFIYLLFGIYCFAMLAAAWWPFDFVSAADSKPYFEPFQPMHLLRRGRLEKDVLKLAMFIPIGIFLVIAWCPPLPSWKMLGRAVLWGAGFSVLMQLGRFFLPDRTPGLADLVMNSAGVLLGSSVIFFHRFSRRVLITLILACIGLFVLAATWPCQFSLSAASMASLANRVEWSPFSGILSMGVLRERLLNGLMMMPLGILVASFALRQSPEGRSLFIAGLVGSCSSLTVELLQCFLPYRTPSVSDILLNTVGALIGGVLAIGLERWSATRERP